MLCIVYTSLSSWSLAYFPVWFSFSSTSGEISKLLIDPSTSLLQKWFLLCWKPFCTNLFSSVILMGKYLFAKIDYNVIVWGLSNLHGCSQGLAIKVWYEGYLMKGKITAEILSKTRNVNTINEEMVFYFLSQIKFSIVIFPIWQHCKARRFKCIVYKNK